MAITDITSFLKPFDYNKQKLEGQQYLSDYANKINQLEPLDKMYGRIGGQLGVPELQSQYLNLGKAASGLAEQIYGIPEMVKGTTQESLVTAPQQQKMVLAAQQPLQESLNRMSPMIQAAGGALTAAQNTLGQQMGYGIQQQQTSLLPFEKGFDVMQTQQAREFSGYTFDNQQELNRLIANLDAGVSLTNAEQLRLQNLAMAEKGYKNELDKIAAQRESSLAGINASGAQERQTAKYNYMDLGGGLQSLFEKYYGK